MTFSRGKVSNQVSAHVDANEIVRRRDEIMQNYSRELGKRLKSRTPG